MLDQLPHLLDAASLAYYRLQNETFVRFPIRLSAAGSCPRALRLKMDGTPERPLDPTGARIYTLGNQRGSALEKGLELVSKEMKGAIQVLTQTNVRLRIPHPSGGRWSEPDMDRLHTEFALFSGAIGVNRDDLPISLDRQAGEVWVHGHPDVVLVNEIGEACVLDFKTANPFALKKLDPERIETVSEGYLVQLATYVSAINQQSGIVTVTSAAIVYEDKADQEHVIVPIRHVGALQPYLETGITNIQSVLKAVIDDVPLARPFSPSESGLLPWQCNYCDVCEACWKEKGWENTAPSARIPKGRVSVE